MNDIPHTHGARLEILERGFEDLTKKVTSAPMASADKEDILAHVSDLRSKVDGLHDQHSALKARVYALEGIVGPAEASQGEQQSDPAT